MAAEVADAVIDETVQDKESAIKFYMVANEDASYEQADKIASDVVSDEILDAAVEADEEKKQEESTPFMGGTSFFYIDAEPTFDDAIFAVAKDNAAEVVATQVQGREGIDMSEAKEIASNIVNDVVEKMDAKEESKMAEQEIEFSIISAALFDLTTEELAALYQMEDEIIKEEEQIKKSADLMTETSDIEAAIKKIAALEKERASIVAAEEKVLLEQQEIEEIEATFG